MGIMTIRTAIFNRGMDNFLVEFFLLGLVTYQTHRPIIAGKLLLPEAAVRVVAGYADTCTNRPMDIFQAGHFIAVAFGSSTV